MAESAKSELLVQAEPGRVGEIGAVCSIDEIDHDFKCLFVILGHLRPHCEREVIDGTRLGSAWSAGWMSINMWLVTFRSRVDSVGGENYAQRGCAVPGQVSPTLSRISDSKYIARF
jgi:hypothetical protein